MISLFKYGKDGGPESHVEGWWLIEWKKVFSVVLLKFNNGGRDVFHSHAFNAWSWYLKGEALEETLESPCCITQRLWRGLNWPKYTPKGQVHRVKSKGVSWVLSVRGPWQDTWEEHLPEQDKVITLTHRRKVLSGN